MKSLLITLSFLAAMGTAVVARAQDSVSSKQGSHGVNVEGRWSFGAGVGGVLYGSDVYGRSAAAGLSALGGGNAGGAFGTVLIERALSPRLRLGATVTGSYADSEREGDELRNAPSPDRTTASSAGGGISLRWVLNPGDLVEISPLVLVGAQGYRQDGANASGSYDAQGQVLSRSETEFAGYGIHARLGFVVEYRLLARLYLRLETHLLRVERSQVEEAIRTENQDGSVERDRQTYTGISATLGVQPALQIRVLL